MNIDALGSTFEEKTPKRRTCLESGIIPGSHSEKLSAWFPRNWEGEFTKTRRASNAFNPAKLRLFLIL
jgi:hypothetical protein